ncbi:unnamed protein product, partial [Ilex paraguariensis]
GYYSLYGGATTQYPMYGAGAAAAYYPYLNFREGSGGAGNYNAGAGQGYTVQYPHHLYQYSAINGTGGYQQHYGTHLPPTPLLQSGL